jgi:restriction system protein
LQALSPSEFESWVAARLLEMGYSVVQTGGPGDEGIDIKARRGNELVVVQCKRFRTAAVGPHAVRELLGSMIPISATRGILATTGAVTAAAAQLAQRQRQLIELWDGPYLARRWPQAIPDSSSIPPQPWIPARKPTVTRPIARRVRARGQQEVRLPRKPLI